MYEFKKIEQEISEYWRKIGLLSKLKKKNENKEKYFLLDGPPYANDIPHVGHIRNTAYKDLMIRLRFMQGRDVFFQPGFDTHGLPVENKVEKLLNLKSKKDIEKIGVAKFTAECKKLAATNKELWLKVYDKLGAWYSWKEPYLTYKNSYIESGWWTFKEFWKKDLVYEGKKPVFWCPHCQTALAGYEVTDSYKMVSDPSIFIKFKIKDKDEFLLVYTTTPWTLIANTAVAVHPDEDYVKVNTTQGRLIIAKPRLNVLTELGIGYKIEETFKGKNLDKTAYEPLLDIPLQQELNKNPKAHKVRMSIPIMKKRVASKIATKKKVESGEEFEDFVTMEEGTGLVHTAPGHGRTDNEVGQFYELPVFSPLDDECRFTEEAGKYKEMFVKDADKLIIGDLEKEGKLLYSGQITHSYPLCWRCKSPLIFRMSTQWFLNVTKIKEKMLEVNEKVNWQPEFAKERFRNWVKDAEDWNISRQRYWGIPLPIWRCDECEETKVIGSLEELKKEAVENIPEDFDLHNANNIHLKCKCDANMTRINDISDVWFDSGIAPWAPFGYPFKNKELFDKFWPVDRINESQDQIRGWFYSLMFCGVAIFNKAPYNTVSMPGWTVDEKGQKMSKSIGNVIYAKEAIEEVSADALRFYSIWEIAPYDLQKFNKDTIKKEVWKMFNILWNIHRYLIAQNIKLEKLETRKIEDEWILSRLNSLIKDYSRNLENFEFHNAGRNFFDFIVNNVSRTYIQLTRERIDKDKMPLIIINEILLKSIMLLAPVSPFISEKIYQNMKKLNNLKESVHLEEWPSPDKINKELEENMKSTEDVVQAILAAREKAKLSVRWPLKEAIIVTKDEKTITGVEKLRGLIKTQTNVKEVDVQQTMPGIKDIIKPDFAQLKPDFGEEKASKIIASLSMTSPETIINHIEKQGKYEFMLDKEKIAIVKEHLIHKHEVPSFYSEAEFKNGAVYLNTKLDEELEAEGYAREVTRRIQTLRKKAGLEKKDRISLFLKTDDEFKAMLEKFKGTIKEKVGAFQMRISELEPSKEHKHHEKVKIKDKELEIFF